MQFNPFSTRYLLGLDIQPQGIYLVQIKKTRSFKNKNEERCVHRTMKTFAAEVLLGGKIIYWDRLQAYLRELIVEENLEGSDVVIAMPYGLVRMHQMQIPIAFTPNEIEAEIHLRLPEDLHGMTDAIRLDFDVLSQQKDYFEVLVVVTREDYLNRYTACVEEAGLKVKAIDIDNFAIKRAINQVISRTLHDVTTILETLNNSPYLLAYGLALKEVVAW